MSDFEKAIPVVLEHEGGYVNNPNDNGGATNYGISLRFLVTIDPTATIDDIKEMTKNKAIGLYKKHWWDKYNYGEIDSQLIANKVFDMAVNMGPQQAHILLQKAVNSAGPVNVLLCDGILGSETLRWTNRIDDSILIKKLSEQAALYYVKLVYNKSNLVEFLRGWLNRAYG